MNLSPFGPNQPNFSTAMGRKISFWLASHTYVSYFRKSREENLKLFISEKEGKIVELKREYVQLDEKLNSTERQVESIEATIGHYHDIKR